MGRLIDADTLTREVEKIIGECIDKELIDRLWYLVAIIDEQPTIYNKTINDFVNKIKDICANHSMSTDRYTNEPIYAHEDGTWHSLIDDVVEELKVGSVDDE